MEDNQRQLTLNQSLPKSTNLNNTIELDEPIKNQCIKIKKSKSKYTSQELFVYSVYFSIFNNFNSRAFKLRQDKFNPISLKFDRTFKNVAAKIYSDEPKIEDFKLFSLSAADYKVLLNNYNSHLDLIVDHLIRYSTDNTELDFVLLNNNWLSYVNSHIDLKNALDQVKEFKENNKFELPPLTNLLDLSDNSIESFKSNKLQSNNIGLEFNDNKFELNNKRAIKEELDKKRLIKKIKIEPSDLDNVLNHFESKKMEFIETVQNSSIKIFSSVAIDLISEVCNLSKLSDLFVETDEAESQATLVQELKDEYDCKLCNWKCKLDTKKKLASQLCRHIQFNHLVFSKYYFENKVKDSIIYRFVCENSRHPDDCTKLSFDKYTDKENLIINTFNSNLLDRHIPEIVHQFLIKYGNYTSSSKLIIDLDQDREFGYGEMFNGEIYKISTIINYLIEEENKFATNKASFTYDRFDKESLISFNLNFLGFLQALQYSGSSTLAEDKRSNNTRIVDNRYRSQTLCNDKLLRIVTFTNSTFKISRYFESIKIKMFNLKEKSNKISGLCLNTILIKPRTYILIGIYLIIKTFEVYKSLIGDNFDQTLNNIIDHNENFSNSLDNNDG